MNETEEIVPIFIQLAPIKAYECKNTLPPKPGISCLYKQNKFDLNRGKDYKFQCIAEMASKKAFHSGKLSVGKAGIRSHLIEHESERCKGAVGRFV